MDTYGVMVVSIGRLIEVTAAAGVVVVVAGVIVVVVAGVVVVVAGVIVVGFLVTRVQTRPLLAMLIKIHPQISVQHEK
jgi:hypothetical protein